MSVGVPVAVQVGVKVIVMAGLGVHVARSIKPDLLQGLHAQASRAAESSRGNDSTEGAGCQTPGNPPRNQDGLPRKMSGYCVLWGFLYLSIVSRDSSELRNP